MQKLGLTKRLVPRPNSRLLFVFFSLDAPNGNWLSFFMLGAYVATSWALGPRLRPMVVAALRR
jgi:hypothetical protein